MPKLSRTEKFAPRQRRTEDLRQQLALPDGPLTRHLLLRFMRIHLPHIVEDDSYNPPRLTNTFEYPPDMDLLQRLRFEHQAAIAALLEIQGKAKQATLHVKRAKLIVARFRKERRVRCR